MPVHTYICKDCSEKFDLLIGVTSEKAEFKYRKCGSNDIERTLSSFTVGNSTSKTGSSESSCPTGTCPIG